MTRSSKHIQMALGVAAALCFYFSPAFCQENEAETELTQSVSYRFWYTDWKDAGSGILNLLFYNAYYGNVGLLGAVGYGEGWDYGYKRLEVQLNASYTYDVSVCLLTLGAGFHYFHFTEDYTGYDYVWHEYGPEFSLSALKAISDTGLGIYAIASMIPYVWAENKSDISSDSWDDRHFVLDGGMSYNIKLFYCAAGYRYSVLNKVISDNSFKGPYVQVGVVF